MVRERCGVAFGMDRMELDCRRSGEEGIIRRISPVFFLSMDDAIMVGSVIALCLKIIATIEVLASQSPSAIFYYIAYTSSLSRRPSKHCICWWNWYRQGSKSGSLALRIVWVDPFWIFKCIKISGHKKNFIGRKSNYYLLCWLTTVDMMLMMMMRTRPNQPPFILSLDGEYSVIYVLNWKRYVLVGNKLIPLTIWWTWGWCSTITARNAWKWLNKELALSFYEFRTIHKLITINRCQILSAIASNSW